MHSYVYGQRNFMIYFEYGKRRMFRFYFVTDNHWHCEVISLLLCAHSVYSYVYGQPNFWFNFDYGKQGMFWFYMCQTNIALWDNFIIIACSLCVYGQSKFLI